MELAVEISEFVRQNESIWDDLEIMFSKALLHFHNVIAHSIFSSELCRLRKMVNALILSQPFE